MRKLFIILSLVLSLALIISCSPDQLTKTGQLMYKLSDAGLVSRNSKYVNEAAENVKVFITESEKAFDWPANLDPGEGAAHDVGVAFRVGDGEALYINTVDKAVELLLSAKDSSAKDAVLRDALSAKYDGHTNKDYIVTSKNLYVGIKRDAVLGGMLDVIEDAMDPSVPEKRANMAFVLSMLGLRGVTVDTLDDTLVKIKNTDLPIPLQSYDYDLLVRKIFQKLGENIADIKEMMSTISSAGGSGKKINMDILIKFQKDIVTSVGERNYQTVGDKIAVGIVYSLLSKVLDMNAAYKDPKYDSDDPAKKRYYYACEEGHKYDLFIDFILTETEGKSKLDGILGSLDAIGYIYGAKIDLAGLVAGAI